MEEMEATKVIGRDEALQALESDLQQRKQECWTEIMEVLERYQLRFDVTTIINNNRVMHQLDVVPKQQ